MIGHVRKRTKELTQALRNSLEMLRLGRLSPTQRTPYTSICQERAYTLRRYAAQPGQLQLAHPVLLVPNLMLSPEVYDLEPSASVVDYLTRRGVDVWLVDFGREREGSGPPLTHDDHVLALDACIERVREVTAHDVHLVGYSQGGMFVYEVAALRRCEGIRSLITLAAPVDLHQSLPLDPDLFARGVELIRDASLRQLQRIEAVPNKLVGLTFGLLGGDRGLGSWLRALTAPQLEDLRQQRWVSGEGLAPWPGASLRRFTDEFVMSNRLLQGGFVAGGRVASLADISAPLLYFVGTRDDIARPRSVRAICRAATHARELYEVDVPSGHVGLVAGRRAFELTWPCVLAWLRWREGAGPKPAQLVGPKPPGQLEGALSELHDHYELLRDASTGVARSLRRSLAAGARETLQLSESLHFQVSRLAKLEQLKPDTRVSFGLELETKAQKRPDGAWFIYDGRGQSYAEANRRVNHIVKGLIACGVQKGQHVGVLMRNRPSYLSLVTALSRLGAVAVLLSPESERASLERALSVSPIDALVADPDNVERARPAFPGRLFMLGAPKSPRPEVSGVIDMEIIDTDAIALPAWYKPNPGRASDLAMIMFTTGSGDEPWAARITNRRWAVAAYSTAAFTSLTPKDTVYACTPLHHGSGLLVAASGALVGGARLALANQFVAERFWPEVRRYGATVVFYAGEMLRPLLHLPSHRGEQFNPIRLFAGSGMRSDTVHRLNERYGTIRIMEFYATPEGPGLLGNVTRLKPGALGRPLFAKDELLLSAYDFDKNVLVRDENHRIVEAGDDEPGVLLTRIDSASAHSGFDGYLRGSDDNQRLVRDVRQLGDVWFMTGDVMRRDPQGDYWMLDRVHDVMHTRAGPEFTRPVEDVFYELPDVLTAAVYGVPKHGRPQLPEAALVLRAGRMLTADALSQLLVHRLDDHELPRAIRVVARLAMSDGARPLKTQLQNGVRDEQVLAIFRYDETGHRYFRLDNNELLQDSG